MSITHIFLNDLRFIKYVFYNNVIAKYKLKKISNIEIEQDFYSIVNQILYGRKSLARFGDSEIRVMLGVDPKDYQQPSLELSRRLKEIIKCNSDNILIGINGVFKGYSQEPYVARRYWASFIRIYFDSFYKELNPNVKYIDSSFTRLYVRRNIKDVGVKFKYIKKIWDNREIVFIEGQYSRLGVGNDLFDNAKSIRRILCPHKNAFNVYKEILEKASQLPKNKLVIIALGASATVLAYDLCKMGYQALDIGHIDLEYEWFKIGVKDAVQIKGKYTNEAANKTEEFEELDDPTYSDSIIAKIGI